MLKGVKKIIKKATRIKGIKEVSRERVNEEECDDKYQQEDETRVINAKTMRFEGVRWKQDKDVYR